MELLESIVLAAPNIYSLTDLKYLPVIEIPKIIGRIDQRAADAKEAREKEEKRNSRR